MLWSKFFDTLFIVMLRQDWPSLDQHILAVQHADQIEWNIALPSAKFYSRYPLKPSSPPEFDVSNLRSLIVLRRPLVFMFGILEHLFYYFY